MLLLPCWPLMVLHFYFIFLVCAFSLIYQFLSVSFSTYILISLLDNMIRKSVEALLASQRCTNSTGRHSEHAFTTTAAHNEMVGIHTFFLLFLKWVFFSFVHNINIFSPYLECFVSYIILFNCC